VVVAGGGYLADSFARILVPDFAFTFSVYTFVGEALAHLLAVLESHQGIQSICRCFYVYRP
jgi:hypothetical protein